MRIIDLLWSASCLIWAYFLIQFLISTNKGDYSRASHYNIMQLITLIPIFGFCIMGIIMYE